MSESWGLACVAVEAVIFVVAAARTVGGTQGLLAEVDPDGGAQAVDDPFAVALLNLLRREISRVVGRTRGVLTARKNEVQKFGLCSVVVEFTFGTDVVNGDIGVAIMIESGTDLIETFCLRVDQREHRDAKELEEETLSRAGRSGKDHGATFDEPSQRFFGGFVKDVLPFNEDTFPLVNALFDAGHLLLIE